MNCQRTLDNVVIWYRQQATKHKDDKCRFSRHVFENEHYKALASKLLKQADEMARAK